jgi:hypothetical protein
LEGASAATESATGLVTVSCETPMVSGSPPASLSSACGLPAPSGPCKSASACQWSPERTSSHETGTDRMGSSLVTAATSFAGGHESPVSVEMHHEIAARCLVSGGCGPLMHHVNSCDQSVQRLGSGAIPNNSVSGLKLSLSDTRTGLDSTSPATPSLHEGVLRSPSAGPSQRPSARRCRVDKPADSPEPAENWGVFRHMVQSTSPSFQPRHELLVQRFSVAGSATPGTGSARVSWPPPLMHNAVPTQHWQPLRQQVPA